MDIIRTANPPVQLPCHLSSINADDIGELCIPIGQYLRSREVPEAAFYTEKSNIKAPLLALQMIVDELQGEGVFSFFFQEIVQDKFEDRKIARFQELIETCELELSGRFYDNFDNYKNMPDRDRRIAFAKSINDASKLERAQGHLKDIWHEVHGNMRSITGIAKRIDVLRRVRQPFQLPQPFVDVSKALQEYKALDAKMTAVGQEDWEDLQNRGVAVLHFGNDR